MRSISVFTTQHGWLFLPAWVAIFALASSSASCFAQYNAQQQQQYQYQMYQQQQMQEQQRRQQEQARQQQAYQETVRLQQQQQQNQQQAWRRMQEEQNTQRRRYNEEEEARRKLLQQLNDSSSSYYEYYDSSGDVTADTESTAETTEDTFEQESSKSGSSNFGVPRGVTANGASLVWLVIGAIIAISLLRHFWVIVVDVWHAILAAADDLLAWVRSAMILLGRQANATRLKTKRSARRLLRAFKNLMIRMKPSRQLMRRIGDVALGATLLLLSSYAFINLLLGFIFVSPETLVAFVLLTIGYLVAILVWLRPRVPQQQTVEAAASATRRPKWSHAFSNSTPIAVTPLAAPPALTIVSDFNSVVDVNKLSAESAPSPAREAPPAAPPTQLELLGRLCCDQCQKQFNVRGQGELAFRLVLCPGCGAGMRHACDHQPAAMDSGVAWMPIISAFCEHCHGLIDIPYGAIGSTVSCPRCDHALLVSDKEDRLKCLQSLGQKVPA